MIFFYAKPSKPSLPYPSPSLSSIKNSPLLYFLLCLFCTSSFFIILIKLISTVHQTTFDHRVSTAAIMGFLHKLWDETVAGPAPESGLGKLRKYNSFSGSRLAAAADDPLPISRSITILRGNSLQIPNLNVYDDSASLPSSPAASSSVPTTPRSRKSFKSLEKQKIIL